MEEINRFFHDPGQSFFLFGPLGTGKSTWLSRHYKEALIIDLLSPDVYRSYAAKPERLKEVLDGQRPGRTIVIYEIQKVPHLLDVVHQLMEQHAGWRFILTGSSSRKLKRSGVDLLAGRAVLKTMHPFMAAELGGRFSLRESLNTGMVPLVFSSSSPQDVLKTYAALYLTEEVQMEGLIRNMGGFSRFLEAISFSHGTILNVANIARECQVERKTVEGYVSVIEDLLLSFRIPVFSRRAKRHLASHPKFYYFDSGVFRSLRPSGPMDAAQEIDGAALEGLVAQHLRAWIAYRGDVCNLFYWRTKSGNEVDFVVYGQDTFYAIEVKNSLQIHPKMLNGLTAFRQDYPEAQLCLLYRGEESLKVKDILCQPCEEFLRNLTPEKPIPVEA
ncbi:conserved hypothetical protein [uncultured Desulfobacterium sp.]|uniref:ATPase n=1 Tax=uncultured Desulfobacterium sp. TaxID=201089 RepID=A0A445MTL5_9BACT|nr:conserved hypothetical protein [uncultured Desulfobacterium sp.]